MENSKREVLTFRQITQKRLKNKDKKRLNKTLWESTQYIDKKDIESDNEKIKDSKMKEISSDSSDEYD